LVTIAWAPRFDRIPTDTETRTTDHQLLVCHFIFGPSYQARCAVNSAIADTVDGVLSHPHAA
jgi:predicted dithiol-disulfide oxidoreductase (DUF899 family)